MKTRLDPVTHDFLVEFGLSDREVMLYLTLLKSGPNTIMNLSRETGIKRSTTHNNVEELIKKGLVSQTNFGERRMVVAESPSKLKLLLDQKRYRVGKMEENLDSVVKSIMDLVPNAKDSNAVEVKYYIGKDQIESIYQLSISSEDVLTIGNFDKFKELFPDSLNLQAKAEGLGKKRKVKDILLDSSEARKHTNRSLGNYQVKFLNLEKSILGFDILIFNNQVAILQLDIESPFAILITSEHISDAFKMIHSTMWQLLS